MKNYYMRFWIFVGIMTLIAFCAGAQTNHGVIEFKADLKNDSDILETGIDSTVIVKVPFDTGNPEQMPSFAGGEEALLRFISKSIKYPTEAFENGNEGTVIVRFTVRKTGTVENVIILRGVSKVLDTEAIRVVSSLPDFNPGKANGVNVDMFYTLPVLFQLSPKPKRNVATLVEKMPQFPGGEAELLSYIFKKVDSLLPPIKGFDEYLPDRVLVRFIINEKGKITNPQIIRGKFPLYNKISLQVVSSMPDWIPGEQNGKKVSVYYTLPIIFEAR